MGRNRKLDTPAHVKLSIPTSLLNAVDEELIDPLTGKPGFGRRSELVTELLREWLEKRKNAANGLRLIREIILN